MHSFVGYAVRTVNVAKGTHSAIAPVLLSIACSRRVLPPPSMGSYLLHERHGWRECRDCRSKSLPMQSSVPYLKPEFEMRKSSGKNRKPVSRTDFHHGLSRTRVTLIIRTSPSDRRVPAPVPVPGPKHVPKPIHKPYEAPNNLPAQSRPNRKE
jgi:hypothetical protein